MKIVKIFQLKIAIFIAVKNRCILHGHAFVMLVSVPNKPVMQKRMHFGARAFKWQNQLPKQH